MKKNMLKNFTKLEDFISDELNRDDAFAVEYKKQTIIHELAKMVQEIRQSLNLTQIELAQKAGTTQPVIARLESGKDNRVPSLDLLAKIAQASNKKLMIKLI